MKEMFLSKFMENARNEREGDDKSENDNEAPRGWLYNLLLKPESKKRIYFEWLISTISLLDIFYNTLNLFIDNGDNMLFNYIVIPFYIGEMYVSWVSSFYIDIKLVQDYRVIIKRYLKSNFVIDLLGTIPFYIFKRYLLVFRLLRLIRFGSYIHKIQFFTDNIAIEYAALHKDTFLRIHKLSRFMISFIFIVHLIAWIWVWIGRYDTVDGWVNK